MTAVAVASGARSARADPCAAPDLIETIPQDGAQGVPTNAQLFARYAATAQYTGQPVQLEHVGVDTQSVPATFDDTEGMLSIAPPSLFAGDSYVVHWPGLQGLDTSSTGSSADAHFEAGGVVDSAPPTFEGVKAVSWDVSREKDSCTNSIDERYVFDLTLGDAVDDGGRDWLTLLVFQTAGPQVDASAPTPVLVQRIPPAGQTARVYSTVDRALGHVCFAAIVRDLTMKVSTSGPAACVDTVSPPFFYGCATARRAAPAREAAWTALGVIALAVATIRRRRRSRGGA